MVQSDPQLIPQQQSPQAPFPRPSLLSGLHSLPAGWSWTTFGHILTSIQAGASFTCAPHVPTEREVGVIKVSAVTWGEFDENESKTCLDDTRINPDILVKENDFLFSRANTIQLVGACVIARHVSRQVMLSDKILRFCFVKNFLPRFALYYLRGHVGRQQIEKLATGNQESMRNIGQDRIRQIRIPLPPLPEQHRIVAAIEQHFSCLDAAVASLERVKVNLKRARASVLKAAVEGRLVPTEAALAKAEHRTFEPASVLLAHILEERRRRWLESGKKGAYKEPAKPETAELPALPEGWVWGTVSHVAECLDYLRRPINKTERSRRVGNIPYYGANGQVGWIDRALFSEPLVLVVEDETFTGREKPFSYIVRGESWVNNHAHVLRAEKPITPEFVNTLLAKYPFTPLTTGTTGRKKLTQQALMEAPVRIPPLAEQHRIVAEVDRRLSVLDKIEASVELNLARCARLRQSILKRAFEGRLVKPEAPYSQHASAHGG